MSASIPHRNGVRDERVVVHDGRVLLHAFLAVFLRDLFHELLVLLDFDGVYALPEVQTQRIEAHEARIFAAALCQTEERRPGDHSCRHVWVCPTPQRRAS